MITSEQMDKIHQTIRAKFPGASSSVSPVNQKNGKPISGIMVQIESAEKSIKHVVEDESDEDNYGELTELLIEDIKAWSAGGYDESNL